MFIKKILVLTLTLILTLSLIACSSNEGDNSESSSSQDSDVPGSLASEVGSFGDFIGWYSNALDSDMPFHIMHIDGEEAFAYDLDGNIIDTAFGDYSEQRALNGNPLIVLDFAELGVEFGVIDNSDDSIDLIDIEYWSSDEGEFYTYYRHDNSPFTDSSEEEIDYETTSTALLDALGDKAEGMTIVASDEQEINGILCKIYLLGTNHEDHFVTEEHYAVSADLQIFYLDVLNDGNWIPYTGE